MPTSKICNKHKLNEELKSFYSLLKLKAHFKGKENIKLTTEEQICKPQKKEKWTRNSRELEKEQTKIKEKTYKNITKNERTSIKKLS